MDLLDLENEKYYKVVIKEVDVGNILVDTTFIGSESANKYVDRVIEMWVEQFGPDTVVQQDEATVLTEAGSELYEITIEVITDKTKYVADMECPYLKLVNVMLVPTGTMSTTLVIKLADQVKIEENTELGLLEIDTGTGENHRMFPSDVKLLIKALVELEKNLELNE